MPVVDIEPPVIRGRARPQEAGTLTLIGILSGQRIVVVGGNYGWCTAIDDLIPGQSASWIAGAEPAETGGIISRAHSPAG